MPDYLTLVQKGYQHLSVGGGCLKPEAPA